jgi:dTDP-4-amino-4,6-dideoxygalactose transaminase
MAHKIIEKAWSKNLLIGDWYTAVVVPPDTRLEAVHYYMGSCPVAEKLSKETFNLPTHINISKNDMKTLIDFLNKHKW